MLKKIIAIAVIIVMLGSNVYAYNGVSSWAESTLDKAADEKLVPDSLLNSNVSDMIKKGECASLCVRFYETVSGKTAESAANPFKDEVSDDVLKAAALGIVGTFSGDEFGENSVASREEIADMMAKTYAAVTGTEAVLSDKTVFADDDLISGWAKESVYFIQDKGIIHIIGSNKFAPRNTSEEQIRLNYANMSIQKALISFVRMYDMTGGSDDGGDKNPEDNIGKICLSMIPKIDFGTAEEPVVGKDSASIKVQSVSQQDYYDYVEKAKTSFREVIYILEGQNYKAREGEYTINIVYANGVLTVEVFKG
ncbi:MAG: hypothetical protein J6N52_09930 [Clostridia bacterium]|nr:hypothetical protein [Clostridia bacterium]